MKKSKIFCFLTMTFIFVTLNAFSQTDEAAEKQIPNQNTSREYKTSLGTFTLESSTLENKEEIQYTEKTFTTSDGGTATYLVNNEADKSNERIVPTDNNKGVIIFPNPSNGKIAVTVEGGGINKIEVYDLLGEIIYQTMSNGEQSTDIDISSESKGMHFYKVTDAKGIVTTGKLVINN